MTETLPIMSKTCKQELGLALKELGIVSNENSDEKINAILKFLEKTIAYQRATYQKKEDGSSELIMNDEQKAQLDQLFAEDNYKIKSTTHRIKQFNNIMQIIGLEEHIATEKWYVRAWLRFRHDVPKIFKPKILKMGMWDEKKSNDLLEAMQAEFPEMFEGGFCPNPKHDKYNHIDVLGTNHFLAKITMDDLKAKLISGEIQTENPVVISLLCGTHVNKDFNEDQETEDIVMKKAFIDAFGVPDKKGFVKIETANNGSISLKCDSISCSKPFRRANTIDTVKKAESKRKGRRDIKRLFITYQPFARRAEEDIRNYFNTVGKDKVSDSSVDMYRVAYEKLETALANESRSAKPDDKSKLYLDKFNKLHFAFPLSEMSRLVYTKTMAKSRELQNQTEQPVDNTDETIANTVPQSTIANVHTKSKPRNFTSCCSCKKSSNVAPEKWINPLIDDPQSVSPLHPSGKKASTTYRFSGI